LKDGFASITYLDIVHSIYDYMNRNFNFVVEGLLIEQFTVKEPVKNKKDLWEAEQKIKKEYDKGFKMLANLQTQIENLEELLADYDVSQFYKLLKLSRTFQVDVAAVDFVLSKETENYKTVLEDLNNRLIVDQLGLDYYKNIQDKNLVDLVETISTNLPKFKKVTEKEFKQSLKRKMKQ
jgi:hypothetical protein